MATVSKQINIQSQGVYTVELNVLPDGKTVTPVNDIQTWLHCAGIWDKNYTTLDEVLADNTTLLALISDHNAVDYMVRSTEWSGNGQPLVPTMTSNTTPSGECIADSTYSTDAAYRAFDNNDATAWTSQKTGSTNIGAYIGYKATKPLRCTKVVLKTYVNSAYTVTNVDLIIQGSNDNSNWENIYEIPTITNFVIYPQTTYTFDFENENSYQYYRLYYANATHATTYVGWIATLQFYAPEGICSNQTAMGYIGNNDYAADTLLADATWRSSICNSTYFEAVLKKKIPTMTNATAPSGQVTASSYYSADYMPYKAFDGSVTNTGWVGATGTGDVNPWCQYMFPDSGIVANKVGFYDKSSLSSSNIKTYKLQGSNNGSSWTDLKKTTLTQGDVWIYVDFANTTKYKYYRWQFVNSESTMGSTNGNGSDFQVWGR